MGPHWDIDMQPHIGVHADTDWLLYAILGRAPLEKDMVKIWSMPCMKNHASWNATQMCSAAAHAMPPATLVRQPLLARLPHPSMKGLHTLDGLPGGLEAQTHVLVPPLAALAWRLAHRLLEAAIDAQLLLVRLLSLRGRYRTAGDGSDV